MQSTRLRTGPVGLRRALPSRRPASVRIPLALADACTRPTLTQAPSSGSPPSTSSLEKRPPSPPSSASVSPLGLIAASQAVSLVSCTAAQASESISAETFSNLIEWLQSLGPAGPAIFLLVVSLCEMIPLFPTQPLSLAGGLLFDGGYGALLVWTANCLAATGAFLLARGAGQKFAKQMIQSEMKDEEAQERNIVQEKLGEVERAIEDGGWPKQFTAVFLLRLTPVVPFSASNYLLGFTPLEVVPFVGATMAGMLPWALLYTSIGAASRRLLKDGANIEDIVTDMTNRASTLSENAVSFGVGVLAIGGAYVAYRAIQDRAPGRQGEDAPPSAPPAREETSTRGEGPSPSSSSSSSFPSIPWAGRDEVKASASASDSDREGGEGPGGPANFSFGSGKAKKEATVGAAAEKSKKRLLL